jgi:predicted Fe-Mo cluster-binding NifX family protein
LITRIKKTCRLLPQYPCGSKNKTYGKGKNSMRIAVTYEDGQIFQHFGRTERFKVYDVEDGKIKAIDIVSTNGNGHGALAGILKNSNVDVLICGGIGGGAKQGLAQAGIQLYGGVTGDVDKAVEDLLANKLVFNSEIECDHHGDSHFCDEHS